LLSTPSFFFNEKRTPHGINPDHSKSIFLTTCASAVSPSCAPLVAALPRCVSVVSEYQMLLVNIPSRTDSQSSPALLALVAAATVNSQFPLRFSQQREVRDVGGLHFPWIDAQPFAAVLNL
jgi:hypothetical protein